MSYPYLLTAAVAGVLLMAHGGMAEEYPLPEGVHRTLVLAPAESNPRNSEGDFVSLKDGRVLFVYTHFEGGGGDHDAAFLAGRFSSDGGRTWTTEDRVIVPNEGGMNVMSVSLLRLQSGAIALFYLRKNATDDCRPLLRISTDEAESWSDARVCIEEPVGYYVVNNDRVIQLANGRLLIPAARHALKGEAFSGYGRALCYLSDDEGKTWRMSKTLLEVPKKIKTGLQEPGVIELRDKRLMMLCRTSAGCQYRSYSSDGGETWSAAEATDLESPTSPASFERIPGTDDILLVWNNHHAIDAERRGKRTPLNTALSSDEGRTWKMIRTLEGNPHGWYCYTAIEFVGDHVLLGHCAGDRRTTNGLALTQVLRFHRGWLYKTD